MCIEYLIFAVMNDIIWMKNCKKNSEQSDRLYGNHAIISWDLVGFGDLPLHIMFRTYETIFQDTCNTYSNGNTYSNNLIDSTRHVQR